MPFPIPYTVVIWVLLVIHLSLTPFFMVPVTSHWIWAGFSAFITAFSMWAIHFIAQEIEHPFGDDDNDVDLPLAQDRMNFSLLNLLDSQMRVPIYPFVTSRARNR